MTTEFKEDVVDGGGAKPTPEQVIAVRDYLKSRNRNFSVRSTHAEMLARNYAISVATVSRYLAGRPGGKAARPAKRSTVLEAQKRVDHDREHRKIEAPQPSLTKEAPTAKDMLPIIASLPDDVAIPTMAALIADSNTSTALAIRENRARMALNIIIAEQMAAKKELLLLDMRGTASLVDALTVAVKLSGGASIDITVPVGNPPAHANGNGADHGPPMKDITPTVSKVVQEIAQWKRERNGG